MRADGQIWAGGQVGRWAVISVQDWRFEIGHWKLEICYIKSPFSILQSPLPNYSLPTHSSAAIWENLRPHAAGTQLVLDGVARRGGEVPG